MNNNNNFPSESTVSNNKTIKDKNKIFNRVAIGFSKKEEKTLSPDFIPPQKDSLLWCCYILLNGINYYNEMCFTSPNFHSEEFNLKKNLLDLILKEPKKIKTHSNHKITKIALEEYKSNLMTGISLKIPELILFCIYYNKSIIVIFDNKCIMRINNGIDNDFQSIINYNSINKKYSIIIDDSYLKKFEIINLFEIQQYTKPIRGISNYKIQELEYIYNNLLKEINPSNKLSKIELYENIYKIIANYINI